MEELSGKTKGIASTGGQRDNDDECLYFTSKTPHFFKVLFDDAIRHGKLKIPAKFVRDYGSELSSPVSLKVPSGAIFKVELTKSNAGTWLHSGWKEFVDHHSLALLDFVVIRYEGDCLFNVIIFDKSASEVKYLTNGQSQGPEAATIKEEQDTSVEILDNGIGMTPSKKRRRGKSPLPCTGTSRKRKIHSNTANRTQTNARLRNLASKYVLEGTKVAGGSVAVRKLRRSTVRGKEKYEALQRASNSFKSQNPFFTIIMQPSFVSAERHSLPIPLTFGKQYLMNQPLREVLCVFEGKPWDMELEIRHPTKRTHLEVRLCKGWTKFLHGNKLDVGDVCVFELFKSNKITFKVVVFRKDVKVSLKSQGNGKKGASQVKTEASESPVPRGSFNRVRRQKTECLCNFASDYPNFKVVMSSGCLAHRIMNVPNAFVKRYIKPKTRLVTLQVAERSWLVQLISYEVKSCLSRGWSVFVKEKSLRKNDICVFELVNRRDAVLRVSIFKHGAN